MKTLELENVGPVSRLAIQVPDEGGVVVLVGANGSGKTKALDATAALLGGRQKVAIRDGAVGASVSLGDARLTVRKTTTRRGELEVATLEGRWDVGQLVDPGLLDADAADSRRIKALIQITGTTVSQAAFYDLFGSPERFGEVVRVNLPDDPVAIAAAVKADAEKAARAAEAKGENLRSAATALRSAACEVDLTAESDSDALQAILMDAVRREAALLAEDQAAAKAIDLGRQAAEWCREFEVVDLGTLETAVAIHQEALATVTAELADLARRLADATTRKQAAAAALAQQQSVLADAKQRHAAHGEWQAKIEAAQVARRPDPETLDSAKQAAVRAREAVEYGAIVRRAIGELADADAKLREAASAEREAAELRSAAAAVDGVLSDLVQAAQVPLWVEGGRLLTQTDRGATRFAELSAGERWRMALDVAITAGGPGCLLVIRQEAWEGLDYESRRLVWEHARARKAVVLTAEAPRTAQDDEGGLVAVEYEP